jgi:mannose-6-phosphate isomerase-like protein (cupin superfamily)
MAMQQTQPQTEGALGKGTEAKAKTLGAMIDKNFGKPDEVREFPKGKVELITFNGATVGRATLQPGWRWSESLKPIAKTESCEAPHFQYHVSGILKIRMDDGTEFECKPGDVTMVPPGHDAWVVGNEPVVLVDFQGLKDYAKDMHAH